MFYTTKRIYYEKKKIHAVVKMYPHLIEYTFIYFLALLMSEGYVMFD
jgi:hypothetical protein